MDFQKTFSFIPKPDWDESCLHTSTKPSHDVTQDKEMMAMKAELNEVKNTLSGYEIGEWGQHTTRMDPASKVVRTVSRTLHPKPFCSNAWCKFYELLVTLRLLDDVQPLSPLHSVHLCEAPGGFICALNHFINTEYRGVEHMWLANTLNPYNEGCKLGSMIPDDRLIRHSLGHWLFGEDNTGDLTKLYNQQHLIAEVKGHLGASVQLVTADGSLDCQLCPSEQEMVVYPLILAEVYTMLSLVSSGGVAVIKMFTLYEIHTLSLLYLLNLVFDEVQIHKPVTSKPGNSEVYVVCKGRRQNVSSDVLALIKSAQESGLPLLSISEIPDSFMKQARLAAAQFKDRQVQTILNNVSSFDNKSLISAISNEKNAKEFISKMRLCSIGSHLSVVVPPCKPFNQLQHELNSYGGEDNSEKEQQRKRRLSGTFTERCQTVSLKLKQLLLANPHSTQPVNYLYTVETTCPLNLSTLDVLEAIDVACVPRKYSTDLRVHSCSFCDMTLLADYNLLADVIYDVLHKATDPAAVESITEFVFPYLSNCSNVVKVNKQMDSSPRGDNCLLVVDNILDDFSCLHTIFEDLKSHDHLLIHNLNCLRRLGAGVVYLLWHCFDEVAVAGHNPVSHLPSVLFKRCILLPQQMPACTDLLVERVVCSLPEARPVRLFPTPDILQCTKLHKSFLNDINNETLRRAINNLKSIKNSTGADAHPVTVNSPQ